MSPAHERDAEREAARIEPVLKRLWEQGKWDPATVRAALLALGYEEGDGALTVQEMFPAFQEQRVLHPRGGHGRPDVHPDACVTARSCRSPTTAYRPTARTWRQAASSLPTGTERTGEGITP